MLTRCHRAPALIVGRRCNRGGKVDAPSLERRRNHNTRNNHRCRRIQCDAAVADAPCFLLHRGLEDAIDGRRRVDDRFRVVQLEEAIETLWKFNSTHHHYLAANVEDLPPSIASHILSFLPAGCAYDERSNGGGTGLWPRDVSPV